MCGGTNDPVTDTDKVRGLSPRVRGNRKESLSLSLSDGSIPACAGEPLYRQFPRRRRWVYPRVCGGTLVSRLKSAGPWGLSPRVRGNPAASTNRSSIEGSIPACAGEPCYFCHFSALLRVYPRVCGGTHPRWSPILTKQGLSPRVRGNRFTACNGHQCSGSIPACAGEPSVVRSLIAWSKVYPRVCGGTPTSIWLAETASGLSPRVRGNLVV